MAFIWRMSHIKKSMKTKETSLPGCNPLIQTNRKHQSTSSNGIISRNGFRSIAKKLFSTLARVTPQCGMISQAVAFSMFLAFFPILLVAGAHDRSLRGKSSQELVVRLSALLPPGSGPFVTDLLARRELNP